MEEQESATADAPHAAAAAAATAALSKETTAARGEMGIATTAVIQGRKCHEYLLCVRAVARFRGNVSN